MTSFELAALVANLLEDKKAKDTLILQTEHVTSLTDYFVIASVESRPQMRAIADYLVHELKENDLQPYGIELDKGGQWTLLDFADVVIHLFHQEDRAHYQLERFWNHATEIPREVWAKPQRQAS